MKGWAKDGEPVLSRQMVYKKNSVLGARFGKRFDAALNGAGKNTPWIKNLTFLLYQLGAKWAYESVFFIIAGDSHFNENWEFGSQWLWPASASACSPQHHLARAQLIVSCPDSLTSRRLTQPNATSHQARLRPSIIFTHTLPQPLLLTIPGNESYLISVSAVYREWKE